MALKFGAQDEVDLALEFGVQDEEGLRFRVLGVYCNVESAERAGFRVQGAEKV